MRFTSVLLSVLLITSIAIEIEAQQRRAGAGGLGSMGGPPSARFDKTMRQLFGENSAFSADMQMAMKNGDNTITMPGKIAYLDGKTRFEMDTTKIQGGGLPPQAAEQMKQMGLAEIISITRPDKKESYMVYPGLNAYAVVPEQSSSDEGEAAAKKPDVKRTEIGKETVEGHECTKYKVVVTDDSGKAHESTIWAAKDLNNFPVKMEMVNEGIPSVITYKNVKLAKPSEELFNPPAEFKRYTDMSAMMQEAMMKRFAPQTGAPSK